MAKGIGVKPLGDRVILERLESEGKSSGGIIIPDTAKEKQNMRGTIVAVGDGGRNEKGEKVKMEVRVGDEVLYGKWSGTEFKMGNKEYLIMKESDIMAIIE